MNIDYQEFMSKLPVKVREGAEALVMKTINHKVCPNCKSVAPLNAFECAVCPWEFGVEGGGSDSDELHRLAEEGLKLDQEGGDHA